MHPGSHTGVITEFSDYMHVMGHSVTTVRLLLDVTSHTEESATFLVPSSERQHWCSQAERNAQGLSPQGPSGRRGAAHVTILGEFRGAEKRRYPKGLLGALRGLAVTPQENALGEGEFEVAGGVLKIRVFFTLWGQAGVRGALVGLPSVIPTSRWNSLLSKMQQKCTQGATHGFGAGASLGLNPGSVASHTSNQVT